MLTPEIAQVIKKVYADRRKPCCETTLLEVCLEMYRNSKTGKEKAKIKALMLELNKPYTEGYFSTISKKSDEQVSTATAA